MVLTGPNGQLVVKVFDFGIAKLPAEHMSTELTFLRTQTGQLLGTPYYMAPEQCRSDTQITDKVDVYALGTVLFCCLAGRTPFISQATGDAAMAHLCAQQIADPPPLLSEFVRAAAPSLVALVDRMLAKSPDDRPSMKEVCEQLKLLQASEERPVNPSITTGEAATVMRSDTPRPRSDAALRPVAGVRKRRLFPYVLAAVLVVWFVILLVWAFAFG